LSVKARSPGSIKLKSFIKHELQNEK